MELIKIKPGEADFQLFETLPSLLHEPENLRYNQWDGINETFLETCLMLLNNGVPLARLAVYNNPFLQYKGKSAACLGNYECVNDNEISKKILAFAFNEAKRMGKKYVIGPMNGSTWDNYRFSIHHDHPNFLLEPYNPLYFNNHFINAGFEVISNYKSSIDHKLPCDSTVVMKLEDRFRNSGVVFRYADMVNFDRELEKLYAFITTAFQHNFLYTHIDWETFRDKYRASLKIIRPEYFQIAEDAQGNIIGFIFCYEDQFNLDQKSLIIKTLARDASNRWSGLGHVLANGVVRLAKKSDFKSVIHAFMLESGTSTKASLHFSGKEYKHYALYGSNI